MNNQYEILGEEKYYVVSPEEYNDVPEGTRLKIHGVVDEKPVVSHARSKRPPALLILRYFIETRLSVGGVETRYDGPAFIRKGEEVTVWGRKSGTRFEAVKIEGEGFTVKIY